jgi:hypothetical protein
MKKLVAGTIGFVAVVAAMVLIGGMLKAPQNTIAAGGCSALCWRRQVEGVGVQSQTENPYLTVAIKKVDAQLPLRTWAARIKLDSDSERFRDALLNEPKR